MIIILSVYIVYRMHKVERRMVKIDFWEMCLLVIYRVNLATGTQKETGLLIPFVVAISGTKFLTNSILVHQNSAQLRTKGKSNVPIFNDQCFGLWPNEIVCTIVLVEYNWSKNE